MTRKKYDKESDTKIHHVHVQLKHEEYEHIKKIADKEERSVHFVSRKAILKGVNFKPAP
jgi:hypothetical protein